MTTSKTNKFLSMAMATAAAGAIASTAHAAPGTTTSGVKDLQQGYQVAAVNVGKKKSKEGRCGEGSCGGDKGKDKEGKCGGKDKEGSCGEGKCGGDKGKDKEGSCGEGKCGGDKGKDKEGSCGEGKCGGKK